MLRALFKRSSVIRTAFAIPAFDDPSLMRLPELVEVAAAEVVVTAREDVLQVRVHDDDCGGAALGRGSGLTGLKDRVEAIGGRISLHSQPGAGTTLHIAVPLNRPGGPAWES